MPSLQGYVVQTHQLSDGREIDVLHVPDDADHLWVPGQQLAALTGVGYRSTGHFSTSDMAQSINKRYVRREPDPHKLYSRSRTRSTALFAVEGLIQKTFRTRRAEYAVFCYEFISCVLSRYPNFVVRNAELLSVWREALDRFDNGSTRFVEDSAFWSAVVSRDARLEAEASPKPPPETELPVEQPLVGVPDVFEDHPCAAYGTYEDPQWIGLYVCDVLDVVDHKQALGRIPAEEKGVVLHTTPQGGVQPYVTLKEPGLYRLIATSNKPEAERFKNWIFREVLPSIRKYGHYTANGAKAGATAEDVRQALIAIMRQELPGVIEPIVLKAVRAHVEHGDLADLVKAMTDNVGQLVEITVINREQLELSRQSIDLITPSHQMFLSAKDYVEADGVTDALRRAPRLAVASFGLDHCTDYGKASLWMKRLCRVENRKVAMNAVARIIAKDAGEEEPPLYIPEFRMKRLERENAKVLVFNPACWARCKQTFLLAGTPTLLFPGPRDKTAPEAKPKAEEA